MVFEQPAGQAGNSASYVESLVLLLRLASVRAKVNRQTRELIFLIRTPRVSVRDVVPAYRAGLSQHTVDWGAVHGAILHRWSHSTLCEIRKAARKLA